MILNRLKERAKEVSKDSVGKISKAKENSTQIIENIKDYNYIGSAQVVGQKILKARRKTIAFYKRPLRDISHLSIIVVIIITLITGFSATFGSNDQVQINPFASNTTKSKQIYLSSSEKRILEADSVAALASVYSDSLGIDAGKTTDDLYKKANIVNGNDKYLASIPVLSVSSASGPRNTVTQYTVLDGDTLSGIAVKFGITSDTIRFANQLEDVDSLKPGQVLTILPVTGVLHTVSAGETIASIAARYNANEEMILSQNNLYGEELKAGMKVMIPDAEIPEAPRRTPEPETRYADNEEPNVSYVAASSGPNHFPYGWCTWWVASKRYVPWSGNAWQWYGNAQAYGRSVGQTPVPGAILVTWESGYGHVAYVESVSGNSFTVSEMNYTGFGRVSSRTVTTSSVPLIGFIY